MDMCRELPFSIDRNAGASLVDQMIAGVKEAVVCGRYKHGERLPSIDAFARLAGVSRKVPKTALSRLLAEGWIKSQPRRGYTVSNPDAPVWKGRILLVCVYAAPHVMDFILTLRRRIMARDYFAQVVILQRFEGNRPDLAPLKLALLGSFDLAYCHLPLPDVSACLAAARVPYVLSCARTRAEYLPRDPYYCGCVCCDDSFLSDVASAMRRAKVRRIAFVDFQDVHDRFVAALRSRGFSVQRVLTPVDGSPTTLAGVRDGAARFFLEAFAGGSRRLPDAFLFMDDYVADGALCALAINGVRVPRDVKVVTLYNHGIGLGYPADFSRIQPGWDSLLVSLVGYFMQLVEGRRPPPPRSSLEYVAGETL